MSLANTITNEEILAWCVSRGCPANARLIRRGEVQVGDKLWSSHYGQRVVTEVFTQGESHEFDGTTEIRFGYVGEGDSRRLLNERYDANSKIPLLNRPSEELVKFFGRWLSDEIVHIWDTSTDISADVAYFKGRAQTQAEKLGLEWTAAFEDRF